MVLPLCFLRGVWSIFSAGEGSDRGSNFRQGGKIRPHRPVADLNDATINKCMRGRVKWAAKKNEVS